MVYSQIQVNSQTIKEKKPSICAIITARGGSKGLPRKNIRLLAGKPLIAYSIEAAKGCSFIEECFVSTEDVEIKKVSLQWGATVIDRPCELATDKASSSDTVRHVLETLQRQGEMPDYFVLLQPTSPLRTSIHLRECIVAFLASKYASCVSVTECEHHPYKAFLSENHELNPLKDYETLDKPRQVLPKAYRQNGAIYILPSALFLENESFCIPPMLPYFMDNYSSIDIDTEWDLKLAEFVLQSCGKEMLS